MEKKIVAPRGDVSERSPYVWLEVDLNAVKNNYRVFKNFVAPAICSGVLKADAYGLGAPVIGKAIFEEGCRHFFVAYLDEADRLSQKMQEELGVVPDYELKENSYHLFVFDGPFIGNWCEDVYKYRYIPVLNTLQNVQEWNAFAESIHQKLPAVLHIDTGLNRLGMPLEEYEIFKKEVYQNTSWIDWRFFMSHAAAAAVPEHVANTIQLERVREIVKDFPDIPFSYADTDCCLLGPQCHFSMVRIGIGLYGLTQKLPELKNCLTVYGTVLQIRDIPAGSGIGYGWDFITEKSTKVATVSCGYADGIAKHGILSFLHFSIHGKKAKVLGRISMDLSVVDITEIENVKVGDKVVIIGEESTIDDFAAACGSSFYTILTGFAQRAKRFFIQ